MEIAVIGCGYIGLVTAVGMAHAGHVVRGVETNPERLNALNHDQPPIYEPGLNEFFTQVREARRLFFTSSIQEALKTSEVILICVGTPPKATGEPDLSHVKAVAEEIGSKLPASAYRVIVIKSTVPVGTADLVRQWIEANLEEHSNPKDAPLFDVASNPEFLREGSALHDVLYPDRIVIGTSNSQTEELLSRLYQPILDSDFTPLEVSTPPVNPPLLISTNPRSAEMIKYAANAFLAMKISFINEMAEISEKIGADIRQVAKGIGSDPRIGPACLQAGVGWGGSCFKKDIQALSHTASKHGCETRLLEATLYVNDRQRAKITELLQKELEGVKGKTIAIMGVSFKPNTNDCRDAPSLTIIEALLGRDARVQVFDPEAFFAEPASSSFSRLETIMEALTGADAVVVMTEWDEIKRIDPSEAGNWMKGDLIIDARNCLNYASWEHAGFRVRNVEG